MAWRLSGNLNVISVDVTKAYPGTVVYTIGDDAHKATASDHNSDARGIVCAIDVMIRGKFTKAAANRLVSALKGRSDLTYIIYNRTIWSKKYGWKARKYTGSNPHTDHVHVSTAHTATVDKVRTHVKWPAAVVSKPSTPVKTGGSTGSGKVTYQPYKNAALGSRVIRLGTVGSDVKKLQKFIGVKPVDGFCGSETVEAIKKYQKMRGYTVDGVAGTQTLSPIVNQIGKW